MKIGFLTSCLPQRTLSDLVPWAADSGFDTLELASWPVDKSQPWLAHHIEAKSFSVSDAERIKALFQEHGMSISALGYYENNVHPDLEIRQGHLAHLKRVVDSAALLGIQLVGTFVGARPDRPPIENLKEIGSVFRELVSYAADRGVSLMIENCPMENWVQFGLPGNYAFSPELWDALFNEVPSDSFGLNLDPSHLHWLGISPTKVVEAYGPKIFHVHAKDAEVVTEGRNRFGILAQQLGDDPWKSGWWRYRMPGRGEIDWVEFVASLQAVGYDGPISIEHEDPEFEGTEELVKDGLSAGLQYLRSLTEA